MAELTVKINKADNVAVALAPLSAGETHRGVTLAEDIPQGHKFALCDIAESGLIIKCGSPVARAMTAICAGALVHTHNAASTLSGNLEYNYLPAEYLPKEVKPKKVKVYRRENGGTGIRNELWIIPVTGYVNGQAELILQTFKNRFGTKGFDGAFVLPHPCGTSACGDGRIITVLQQLIRHPNAGGVLVLGLEDTDGFRVALGGVNSSRVKFLNCLEAEDEIESGVQLLNKIAEVMKLDVREEADISCLKVGLMCGRTDFLTGVTANPLAGAFSDYLASAGGSVALCEIPETFGTEQLLMNRANSGQTFERLAALIKSYKDYFRSRGQSVYRYPSPESTAEGITTIEEQSVACTQKAGSTPVCGVVAEGETVTESGVNILNGAGDDVCAVTNLAAAGCHMVLFTTGLGTPVGGVIPTLKISSNTPLAVKKSNWIDFNAGAVTETDYGTQLEKLIDLVIAVAGGKLTKNEINNTRELAISEPDVTFKD